MLNSYSEDHRTRRSDKAVLETCHPCNTPAPSYGPLILQRIQRDPNYTNVVLRHFRSVVKLSKMERFRSPVAFATLRDDRSLAGGASTCKAILFDVDASVAAEY